MSPDMSSAKYKVFLSETRTPVFCHQPPLSYKTSEAVHPVNAALLFVRFLAALPVCFVRCLPRFRGLRVTGSKRGDALVVLIMSQLRKSFPNKVRICIGLNYVSEPRACTLSSKIH